jgi:UDP-glucose 4-epimerase
MSEPSANFSYFSQHWRKASFLLLSLLSIICLGEILSNSLAGSHGFSSDRSEQYEFEVFQKQVGANIVRTNRMENSKNILVTGGTGYIGVHTIVPLLEAGYDVTVVDNLINSSPDGLKRVLEITKADPHRIRFFQVDLLDAKSLEEVFESSPRFVACIHFAGLKAVGESVQKPLLYYETNIGGTLNLLKLMDKYGCRSIIFSSSATVYGSAEVPIKETTQTGKNHETLNSCYSNDNNLGVGITNAYGRTKYMIEEILKVSNLVSLMLQEI